VSQSVIYIGIYVTITIWNIYVLRGSALT